MKLEKETADAVSLTHESEVYSNGEEGGEAKDVIEHNLSSSSACEDLKNKRRSMALRENLFKRKQQMRSRKVIKTP